MDFQYENRYTATFKMYAEFYRKHATGPRYWTFVFMPFMLLIAILAFVEGEAMLGVIWCTVLLFYFLPQYYAWAAIRNTKRLNNGDIPMVSVRFGDAIEMEEGAVRLTVQYSSIVRVVRLKHSYVLMTSRRTGVMLRDDGFTDGTFYNFRQFLHEKRPDLKIPE